MKMVRATLLMIVVLITSGCGSMFASISHGPRCPYDGVKLSASALFSWEAIVATGGLIIPMAIIDLPFSFIYDTLMLEEAEGDDKCS